MSRKKRTPEENERREKIRELLKISNVGSMEDIQKLFCSISIVRVGLFFHSELWYNIREYNG